MTKLSRLTPLHSVPREMLSSVKFILTDIDDTLTWQSQLPSVSYDALVRLKAAGFHIIPVTGGCAGWSDLIARLWPVDGVITEGGACYLHKDNLGRLQYEYWEDADKMKQRQSNLLQIVKGILPSYPELKLAQDQSFRLTDVAVDYAQDVIPSQPEARDLLLAELHELGIQAKASSIHINIWQGEYDKFTMARRVLMQRFGLTMDTLLEQVLYVGDSPNDESMFAHFPLSVGVSNIQQHLPKMTHQPAYLTQTPGGLGFAELSNYLLNTVRV